MSDSELVRSLPPGTARNPPVPSMNCFRGEETLCGDVGRLSFESVYERVSVGDCENGEGGRSERPSVCIRGRGTLDLSGDIDPASGGGRVAVSSILIVGARCRVCDIGAGGSGGGGSSSLPEVFGSVILLATDSDSQQSLSFEGFDKFVWPAQQTQSSGDC